MRRRTVPIMTMPLCPLVLQLLAVEPRDVGAVARELARRGLSPALPDHQAAIVTVGRLQQGGLVYTRGAARAGRVYRITDRGRRKLAFHRGVARTLAEG